jgi:hypothetical protein
MHHDHTVSPVPIRNTRADMCYQTNQGLQNTESERRDRPTPIRSDNLRKEGGKRRPLCRKQLLAALPNIGTDLVTEPRRRIPRSLHVVVVVVVRAGAHFGHHLLRNRRIDLRKGVKAQILPPLDGPLAGLGVGLASARVR